MITTEDDILINRPVNEVTDFFVDPENVSRWTVGVKDLRADGPPGIGTKLFYKQTFLGKQNEWVMETTEFEPNKTFAMRSISGPFPMKYRYTFEPIENATRMTALVKSQPGGFYKLAEPLVTIVARRAVRASLETLKDLLEAEALASK